MDKATEPNSSLIEARDLLGRAGTLRYAEDRFVRLIALRLMETIWWASPALRKDAHRAA